MEFLKDKRFIQFDKNEPAQIVVNKLLKGSKLMKVILHKI